MQAEIKMTKWERHQARRRRRAICGELLSVFALAIGWGAAVLQPAECQAVALTGAARDNGDSQQRTPLDELADGVWSPVKDGTSDKTRHQAREPPAVRAASDHGNHYEWQLSELVSRLLEDELKRVERQRTAAAAHRRQRAMPAGELRLWPVETTTDNLYSTESAVRMLAGALARPPSIPASLAYDGGYLMARPQAAGGAAANTSERRRRMSTGPSLQRSAGYK